MNHNLQSILHHYSVHKQPVISRGNVSQETSDGPVINMEDLAKITQKNGEERHSWIQVWYPDIGWVDYDVTSPFLGITSRYIIQNIGLDSYEAQKKWRFSKGYKPKESEEIMRKFYFDDISLDFSEREIESTFNGEKVELRIKD